MSKKIPLYLCDKKRDCNGPCYRECRLTHDIDHAVRDDEIKVGDFVERYVNGKFDSTGIYLGEAGDYWNCLFWTGAVFTTFAYPKNQFKKTGIHLGIDKIMEEMKNE